MFLVKRGSNRKNSPGTNPMHRWAIRRCESLFYIRYGTLGQVEGRGESGDGVELGSGELESTVFGLGSAWLQTVRFFGET